MLDWYGSFLYWMDLDWERRALIRVLKRRIDSLSLLTGENYAPTWPISTQETEGVKRANPPESESLN